MKEIKLTQNKVAIIDDEDFEEISKFKWFFNEGRNGIGYAVRKVRDGKKHIKVYMHSTIINTSIELHTDHINCNTLDNRKSNLRTCTNQ